MHRQLFIISLLILLASTSYAQSPEKPEAASEHNPNRALALSLLPGAGQIYNGQAWKVPIIYGAFATMGYFIYSNYSQMHTFKDEYLYRVNSGTPQLEGYTNYPNSSIYNMYQSYNKNFQLMIIITAAIYGLNLLDAYIFGHLYDFQIDDNLAFHASPSIMLAPFGANMLTPAMQISFTF